MKKLSTAIAHARSPFSSLHRVLNGVVRFSRIQASAEQIRAAVAPELPPSQQRRYSVEQLVEAVLVVDASGRYRWRD